MPTVCMHQEVVVVVVVFTISIGPSIRLGVTLSQKGEIVLSSAPVITAPHNDRYCLSSCSTESCLSSCSMERSVEDDKK